jgi:hypothetical protein
MLKSILFEINKYEKVTKNFWPDHKDEFKEIIDQKGLYIHFSEIPKLGINPVNEHETPHGIYAYPLHKDKISLFAIDRNFMIIFKVKDVSTILDTSKYTEDDLRRDVKKIKDIIIKAKIDDLTDSEVEDEIDRLFNYHASIKANVKTPAGKLWYIIYELSMLSSIKLSTSIMRKIFLLLGYHGVTDENGCSGIIHHNEPCQAVFFNNSYLEIIDILDRNLKYQKGYFDIGKNKTLSIKLYNNVELQKNLINNPKIFWFLTKIRENRNSKIKIDKFHLFKDYISKEELDEAIKLIITDYNKVSYKELQKDFKPYIPFILNHYYQKDYDLAAMFMVFVGLEDFLTVDEMNDEQFIFFISNGLKIYNEFYTVNVFFQKEKQHILNRALQIKQKNNIKNYYQKKLDNIINTFKSF